MRELLGRTRQIKPRTLFGLIALGLFLWAWLGLAEMSTSGCDDGCGGEGWTGDPDAPQWDEQLRLAQAGAILTLLAAGAWLARWRLLALPIAIAAAILFAGWYSIATHARFGP